MAELTICFGDNLPVLQGLPVGAIDLIYIDSPFNTGKAQSRTRLSTARDENGDRTGFHSKRYRTIKLGTKAAFQPHPLMAPWVDEPRLATSSIA